MSVEPALSALLEPVCEIAREASVRILEVYATDFSVAQKEDNSPVTQADLAAHEVICEALSQLTPDIPVLSEESAHVPFAERSQWQRYWLVDPLDGTKEFVKKNGEFTVNIALVVGHEVALGVVYVPVTGVVYYAAQGVGAFCEKPDAAPVALHVRKASASHLVVAGSRSHGGQLFDEFTRSLPGQVELVTQGSSLKLCLVAEGTADVYPRFGLTSEWDTAAAQCVVEQAGGSVTNLELEPLRYNTKESLLNSHFLVLGDRSFPWTQHLPAAVGSARS